MMYAVSVKYVGGGSETLKVFKVNGRYLLEIDIISLSPCHRLGKAVEFATVVNVVETL